MYSHQDTIDFTYCIADSCIANEILQPNGTCKSCPSYYHFAEDGIECVQDDCEISSYLTITGYCQECAPYSYQSE